MKKTISINISGQVFNIEEDSYEKLKNYLGAITKYFSSYGDSKEILTDIEGRIAEKFLEYLKKEEKQAISSQNVDSIIASMGTVADFEAIKEDEDLAQSDAKAEIQYAVNEAKSENSAQQKTIEANEQSAKEPKRFYRDNQRKIISGVCAGIAHYFNMDPVWIRLLFLGCLGFIPVLAAFSAFIFILYIACWIAFPANNNLKEDEKIKKFFRDPDKKVLAGVVAGVSKYTGIDLAILRLIFVLSIPLAGTGIMVYLILWAIAPFAKTITDKMQMKGEAITLENIDSNIKSANTFSPKAESAIATILLFPFRIIGKIFSAIGPLFQFLLVGVRIFAGLLLILIGGAVMIGLVIALFSSWGAFGDLPLAQIDNTPLYIIGQDAPKSMFFFLFFAIAIPFLGLALAGISMVSKRNIFNPVILQTMGGLWLMGLLGSGMSASKYASNFKRGGSIEKTLTYQIASKTPTFDISDNEGWDNYNEVHFYIEANNGADLEVNELFEAREATEEQAQINTQTIKYDIKQADSLITFDRTIELTPKSKFRNQELTATIKIPKEKVFYLTRRFAAHFSNFNLDWDTVNWDVNANKVKGNEAARFKFDNEGNLVPIDKNEKIEKNIDENGQYYKEYSFNNFNSLELYGNLEVEIEEGTITKIVANAESEDALNHLNISQENDKLKANYNHEENEDSNVKIKITLPKVKYLQLADQVSAKLLNIDSEAIKIKLSNNGKLEIEGKTNKLELELRDQSNFEGENLKAIETEISTYNQSKANINVENKLKAESFDQSEIEYLGSPKNVNLSPNGQSKISKTEEDIN